MSRLIDELNRATKAVPQPMGFRAGRTALSGPRLLLVASLTQSNDNNLAADSVKGADAVILRFAKSNLTARTLQKVKESAADIPWGAWLEDINAKKLDSLVEGGCDFVVFPPDSRFLAAPQDDKVGKILQVESSVADSLLRAVNDLPVDAVLINDVYEGKVLAWNHLLVFQRLANLLSKPLLVPALADIEPGELQALWETGVDGVVVETGAETPGRLQELRRTIEGLDFRPSRKRGKIEAILPRIAGEAEAKPEEEEEEGDEDE